MNEQTFWRLIQQAHEQSQGDMDQKCEAIIAEIAKLSKQDATEFSHFFDAMMDKAYTWSLWGAAYIMGGGCSDDSFSDFRAALISRGREAFEKAVAFPDSLADEDFDEEAWFYESYAYAVTDGVEAVLGFVPERNQSHPVEPAGEEWSEENLDVLFPKLGKKFD